MPFFLLFVGVILITAAYRNKQSDLFALVKSDFFGPNNYFVWVLAVFVVGAAGSIKQIKPISDAFLVLIILVIIVANYRNNQDIFTLFVNEIKQGTAGDTGTNSLAQMATGQNDVVGGALNIGQQTLNKAKGLLNMIGIKP